MPMPLILIADDQPTTLLVLEDMLAAHYAVRAFGDGRQLLAFLEKGGQADLVLTDVVMPGIDGFEVCRRLKSSPKTRDIPVLFLSGLESDTDEAHGLSLGAEDFIHKPFTAPVVLARVRNHLALSRATRQLQRHNDELERLVEERTREILRRGEQLIAAQDATITALCTLAEIRDNETGNHIIRTQQYVWMLAKALRNHPRFRHALTDEAIRMVVKSAPLHDVGKVAIPDAVLLKTGRLNAQEWEIMQRHCEFGRAALAKAAGDFAGEGGSYLQFAMEIAHSHHERWDGGGYPQGLRGDAIPVSARLMALADVYDALISKRIYKPAFPHDQAVQMIIDGRGGHFDPDVADAFVRAADQFFVIAEGFRDTD